MGPVGGGASTPHYGTPISRNGTHDAPMEIGSVWGTLDAPIWHLRYTGEWDVEAPSPTTNGSFRRVCEKAPCTVRAGGLNWIYSSFKASRMAPME